MIEEARRPFAARLVRSVRPVARLSAAFLASASLRPSIFAPDSPSFDFAYAPGAVHTCRDDSARDEPAPPPRSSAGDEHAVPFVPG